MIKNSILITVLLFHSIFVVGQEQEPSDLLVTNSSWGKELFVFPLGFAREIDYRGTEDARFPKGWGDSTSANYFTYAFAWELEVNQELTTVDFEVNLQYYFDGLLGLSFPRKDLPQVQKTNAIFIKTEASDGDSRYIGKIKTFDTRITKKPLMLHVTAQQRYCPQTKKTLILFKFSPKFFESNVWSKLEEVKLHDDGCVK